MESSNDSFVWSDASNDYNCNSKITVKKPIEKCEDESESGYTYKKKIQMELFSGEQQNFVFENNDAKKSKKRKHIDLDSSHIEEPLTKYIKTEPESDLDVTNKKKKRKSSVSYHTLHDEDFLNLKVKEEQSSIEAIPSPKLKAKKKRRHRNESHENLDSFNNGESDSLMISNSHCEISSIVNISEISHVEDVPYLEKELQDTEYNRTKKKKSKRKKQKYITDEMTIEDKFSAEETMVGEMSSNVHTSDSIKINNQKIDEANNHNGLEYSDKYDEDQNSDTEVHENNINKTVQFNISKEIKRKNSILENVNNNDETILSSGGTSNKLSQIMPKISDRIRFEEEDSLVLNNQNSGHNKTDKVHSAQLHNYLKLNTHLKQITPTPQSDCIISPDDEIWVLKCPHEIDVKSLKDTSLVLDNKCKLKINSQTYVGSMENKSSGVVILTLDDSKPVIKNILLNGIVHFHKRIPKPHFQEDNIIVNNQTNFIPLPETKYRHPLFGANYKKSIKIPKHISQRLNYLEHQSIPDNNDKKKKKKKKHKKENSISENEQEAEPKPEIIEIHHKKRKRKHSQDNDTPPKLTKYLKHDPDSAEAWESEKAIEQQLFNF